MHYSSSGFVTAKDNDGLTYAQEIEVTNRADGLYIRHHFSGLSNNKYEIVWPESSTNRSCYLEEVTACSRLDDQSASFTEGEEDRQSIMYFIPKDGPMVRSSLFKNIFATLADSEPTSNFLHLTDETGIGGMWVSGLELLGSEERALINYSLFSGYGELTDLYWQKNLLPSIYEGEKLSIFGIDTNVEAFERVEAILESIEAPHKTIVVDASSTPVVSKVFKVTNELDGDRIVNSLIVDQVGQRYSIPQEEQLTAEVVASLLSGKSIGIEKSTITYEALVDNLTQEELEKVISKISEIQEEPVSASLLDKTIEEVTGYKTSFLVKNNSADAFYPLLFEDTRAVYIDGEESTDVAVIIKDGKVLYPGTKIMRELGFNISSNEQSLYMDGGDRSFRFPLKEPFYVYNDRKYSMQSVPFERVGDEFYFVEAPFIRIFILGIEKTAEKIDIIPRVKFEGEKTIN